MANDREALLEEDATAVRPALAIGCLLAIFLATLSDVSLIKSRIKARLSAYMYDPIAVRAILSIWQAKISDKRHLNVPRRAEDLIPLDVSDRVL